MCVSFILHTSLSSHFTIIMSIIVTLTILDDFILSELSSKASPAEQAAVAALIGNVNTGTIS